MTQIVGFAGKKQSGKNTACNYILALKLAELGVCKKSRLSQTGEVEVTDVFGERANEDDWFAFSKENVNINKLTEECLGPYIKMYGLADTLKDMCVDIFGIPRNQCYGTDEEKNSLTDIRWENIPHTDGKSGAMTAREVLQHVGTDIFRQIDPNIWIKSLLRKINKDSPEVALVCDVRFENEILGLQGAQGFIVGLTRDPYQNKDQHASEQEITKALKLCDTIVDNKNMDIKTQIQHIHSSLEHLPNVIPKMEK
jgi:hypothetical protein